MRIRTSLAGTALCLTAVLFASTAQLRGQDPGLQRDMEFVRELAKNLGFIGLAKNETERLRTEHKSSDAQESLMMLGIEVDMIGARIKSNRAEQRTLYESALEEASGILETRADNLQALSILIEATHEYGLFLVEELQLAREQEPARVPELEETAARIFRNGVDACDKAMQLLEPQIDEDEDKRLEHGVTWMRKGLLLREQARAVRKDRGYLLSRARQTLEDLVFEWGEETALGLRAMFEYAQCAEVEGELGEAAAFYQDTIDGILASLEDEQIQLPAETEEFLLDMTQEVYAALVRVHFEEGATDKVMTKAQAFRELLQKYGQEGADPFETAHQRYGHEVFLIEARAMAESGDAEKIKAAMAMAQRINDAHPNDFVGHKAKNVIKDILAAQRSLVSGELLFEIAKGDYQKRNHVAARSGFKKALAAMSPEEGGQYGMEAWDMLGFSYAAEDRYLESVLAYHEGLREYGTSEDTKVEKAVEHMQNAMSLLKQQVADDAVLEDLDQQTADLVMQFGGEGSADQRNWRAADSALVEGDYEKAASLYGAITTEYPRYDVAQARQVQALALAGKYEAARQKIEDFRAWLETPEAEIPSNEPELHKLRRQALAELAYREASMEYKLAVGAEGTGEEKDLSRYPAAIAALRNFIDEHAEYAGDFLHYAYNYLVRLYVATGEFDLAEEAFRKLKQTRGGASLVPAASTAIFLAWTTERDNRQAELDAAVEAGKSGEELQPLREAVDAANRKLVSLGMEYAQESAKPQYGILRHTIRACEQLGDWENLETLARRTIELYGEDPDYGKRVDSYIRPGIGRALLNKQRFQEAYDMLTAAEEAQPNNYEIKRLICLALGGWVEFNEIGQPIRVAGLGRHAEAYDKWVGEYRDWATRDGVPRYGYEYYEFQWYAYYWATRAAEKDQSYDARAAGHWRNAKSIDDFAALRALGEKGDELYQLFQVHAR